MVDEKEGEEKETSDEVDEAEEVEADEEDETSEVEDEEKFNPLFDELNALATGEINIDDEEISKKPEEPPAQPEQSEQPAPDHDVLDGVDFDDVVSKPEVFRQVLDRVGERMQQTIEAKVLEAVTQIAGYQVQQQMALQNLTNKFWEANQDLEPVRPYVAKIATTIQSQRPDLPLQKIFEKTAEVARKKLGLTKIKGGGGSPISTRRSKPALVKSGGRTRSTKVAPKLSKQQQEIADLINLED